jgi:hypothetical protein
MVLSTAKMYAARPVWHQKMRSSHRAFIQLQPPGMNVAANIAPKPTQSGPLAVILGMGVP